jgi:DNA repair protein RadA/Sms
MSKSRTSFVCQACGAVASKWSGRCEACNAWNSIVEEVMGSGIAAAPALRTTKKGRAVELENLQGVAETPPRLNSSLSELDRVTGGGFVQGSAVLIGGDPGIGKSTLLIQAAAIIAKAGHRVIYISGEEAIAQIRLRAERLGLADAPVSLAAETSVENIIATLEQGEKPQLVIIDSIQTMWTDIVESAPGTVTQVRTSAQALIRYAKKSGAAMVFVGHMTKDGQIAGPRVVEHMVDAVLYFEGDNTHRFRILRAVKNRFGATDEIGLFEMTGLGLSQVANPSELFLDRSENHAPGTAVFAGVEGTRPVLVDIQALVAPSSLSMPRRTVVGWDTNRLSMILAVLEARCGVRFSHHDVYLTIAGGLRIAEPAADLAVAAALISALTGQPLSGESVFFGEAGLTGAVRPVNNVPLRIKEAERLGFTTAYLPQGNDGDSGQAKLGLRPIGDLTQLVASLTSEESTKMALLNEKTIPTKMKISR